MVISRVICKSSSRHAQCFFFVFGILIGITFGCTLTLMLTDWRTTYYYYTDGNGLAFELRDAVTSEFSAVEVVKATEMLTPNHLYKRDETENDAYVRNVLEEIDEQTHKDPKDIPNWYNHESISKYNYEVLSKSKENFWLHQKEILVTVFVKTCNDISKLSTLQDTWGEMVDLLIFISSDCQIPHHLQQAFIIQLPELGSFVYPPQKRTFSILRYIFEKYGSSYSWFLLLNDVNTYINTRYLQKYVHNLNYNEAYYIGIPKRLSIEELQNYDVYQHEQFCQSKGGGVLFSNGLLQKLTPLLNTCLNEYIRHLSTLTDEDIELGRCISRKLGIQCWSGSEEQNKLFYIDTEGELINPAAVLFSRQSFSDVVSLYPVKTDMQMNLIHFYYGMLEYNNTKKMVVSLGKSVALFCQMLSSKYSSSTEVQTIFKYCNINGKEDLAKIVTEEMPAKFSPTNLHEVQSWDYFDAKSLYIDEATNPRKVLEKYKFHKEELEEVLIETIRLANVEYPSHLVFYNLVNGYVRHIGLKGNEYIVDVEFNEANNPYVIVQRRFSLLKPLSPNFIVQPSKSMVDELVTFLVPINRVTDRLEEFLAMYEEVALATNEVTRLAFVVFGEEDILYCKSKAKSLSMKYPNSKYMIVEGIGEFARAKALDMGMKALDDNSLVFICDVDMNIKQSFLNRCRKNTIKGQQVYYPEMFKWYNKEYVYKFKRRPFRQQIARDTGHWAHYSYGMLCMYRSDYIVSGGFDTNIVGWGGEDVKFYENVLKANFKVIRAPDPGVSHRWHEKKCFYNDRKRYQDCLHSKSEILADRRELARYIFEVEERKETERFFCL